MQRTGMTTPRDTQQSKANLRLAVVLASVALAFFAGFLVKMMYFGH